MMTSSNPANDNGLAGLCILFAGGPQHQILELATVAPIDSALLAVVWEELRLASRRDICSDLMVERRDADGAVVDDMCVSLRAVEQLAKRPLAALLRTATPRHPSNAGRKGQ